MDKRQRIVTASQAMFARYPVWGQLAQLRLPAPKLFRLLVVVVVVSHALEVGVVIKRTHILQTNIPTIPAS